MSQTKADVTKDGQQAFLSGIQRRNNPHKSGSWQNEAWDNGWIEAHDRKVEK